MSYFVRWGAALFRESSAVLICLYTAESDYRDLGYVDETVLRRLWALIADRMTLPWYFHFFTSREGPFDTFEHAGQVWAIRSDAHDRCAAAMESLTPAPITSVLLSAPSAARLQAQIREALQHVDLDAAAAYGRSDPPRRGSEPFDTMVERLGGQIVGRETLEDLRRRAEDAEDLRRRAEDADALRRRIGDLEHDLQETRDGWRRDTRDLQEPKERCLRGTRERQDAKHPSLRDTPDMQDTREGWLRDARELKEEVLHLKHERELAQQRHRAIEQSRFWRLTAPARRLMALAKGGRRDART